MDEGVSEPLSGRYGRPAGKPVEAWECSACAHLNHFADVCEACGVSRRYFEDPPLDLPYTPRLTSLPSFWLALLWSLAALAGVLLALLPGPREALGIGTAFIALEVIAATLAAGSSFLVALWERWFNQVELVVPPHVRSGEEFEVALKLVPYRTLAPVSLTFRLVDRFYVRTKDGVETSTRALELSRPLERGSLRGRRVNAFTATFLAPFPATAHTDIRAEIAADLLGVVGVVVPALQQHARNLREHGGYYVEARLSVGPIARRLQKRVISYLIGESVYVG